MGKTSRRKKSAREFLGERMVYTARDMPISAGSVRSGALPDGFGHTRTIGTIGLTGERLTGKSARS